MRRTQLVRRIGCDRARCRVLVRVVPRATRALPTRCHGAQRVSCADWKQHNRPPPPLPPSPLIESDLHYLTHNQTCPEHAPYKPNIEQCPDPPREELYGSTTTRSIPPPTSPPSGTMCGNQHAGCGLHADRLTDIHGHSISMVVYRVRRSGRGGVPSDQTYASCITMHPRIDACVCVNDMPLFANYSSPPPPPMYPPFPPLSPAPPATPPYPPEPPFPPPLPPGAQRPSIIVTVPPYSPPRPPALPPVPPTPPAPPSSPSPPSSPPSLPSPARVPLVPAPDLDSYCHNNFHAYQDCTVRVKVERCPKVMCDHLSGYSPYSSMCLVIDRPFHMALIPGVCYDNHHRKYYTLRECLILDPSYYGKWVSTYSSQTGMILSAVRQREVYRDDLYFRVAPPTPSLRFPVVTDFDSI